jgi:pyruvate,water dikinase
MEGGKRKMIVKGLGASPGLASGKVRILRNIEELDKVKEGDVLVTTMTNPDMVPAMKRAVAIVTEEGGMTCHAAIVSRELGIPSIVGTGSATAVLKDGDSITVDGSRGIVYQGSIKVKESKGEVEVMAQAHIVTATEVKVNLSIPDERIARKMAAIADGVGLLRVEHIILGMGRHPISFIKEGKEEEFIEKLHGDLKIVVDAFYPKIVYIRTLDAPTDEFRSMKGGEDEPYEHNPMLGWRGIRRGLDQPELLRAELRTIKRLVEENYTNIGVMFPLIHHPEQVAQAKRIAEEVGLIPHKHVKLGIMVETPASAVIIEDLIKEGLDFISFGTNDLTQYTLALDRNNERVAKHFTEKHPAVLRLMEDVIKVCNRYGVETSICGQAGSDPEVVKKLVTFGITSVSANPDAVLKVRETVARAEKRLLLENARRNQD